MVLVDGALASDLAAVSGGIAAMGIEGILNWKRRSDAAAIAQRMEKMNGQGILRAANDSRFKAEGVGQIAIAGFGDFMSNLLPATLESVQRASADSYINQIYLGQAANDLRSACMREMPEQYRGRVTELVVPMFPDGFGGASADEIWEQRKWWMPELESSLATWGNALDANTAVKGSFSSMLWLKLSVNGHRLFAPYAVREYKKRNPRGEVYALLPYPTRTTVREELPAVYEGFGAQQPRGYVGVENLGDQRRGDFGLVQLLAAQVVGNWVSSHQSGETALNGLNAIFPKSDPGRTGTISVLATTVPVFFEEPYKNKIPAMFHTSFPLLEHHTVEGIEEVLADETLQSVPLRKSKKGSARSLIVIAPLVPSHLRRLAIAVDDRIGPMLRSLDVDLNVQYASIGQPLTPGGTAVISFLLLQALDATRSQIADYVRGKTTNNPAVLPHARNGHSASLNGRVTKQLAATKKGKK